MEKIKFNKYINALEEMLYQYDSVICNFKEKHNYKIAAITCGFLPVEIVASFGIIPLFTPSLFRNNYCNSSKAKKSYMLDDFYDYFFVPNNCIHKTYFTKIKSSTYCFKNFSGYGEDAAEFLNEEINNLLKFCLKGGTVKFDSVKLQETVSIYNDLRKLIRGIDSLRNEKPAALSSVEMSIIHESALIFPPQIVIGYLANIFEYLKNYKCKDSENKLNALVYAGNIMDYKLLDDIEECGILLLQDDLCCRRREFDLSFNTLSDNLYNEILEAFTYRPLCPCLRNVDERFELFYKMIKNHGISIVIFIEDNCCESKKEQIKYLRVKLMRTGVDPIVVDSKNAVEKINIYVGKVKSNIRISKHF